MIILGDIHLQENWIKKKQVELFFNWLNNQDFLKKESTIILLGDLFEIPVPSSSLVSFYLNLFLNTWKDKYIYILQGNHDYNLSTSSLDFFESLDNVKIINNLIELNIEDKKCLFLPHYSHEGTNKQPMVETYSNLSGTYDYIFGHIEDEEQHFTDKFCNLANIKGLRVFGHIHTPTIQKNGHYLGSCVKNSSTEKDDEKYLALINESLQLIKIPNLLNYETIKYGDEVKDQKTLILLNVNEAPSKIEAINFYENKYPNVKINKVITKRQEMLETKKFVKSSDDEAWKLFCEEKQLTDSVKNICEKVIKDQN